MSSSIRMKRECPRKKTHGQPEKNLAKQPKKSKGNQAPSSINHLPETHRSTTSIASSLWEIKPEQESPSPQRRHPRSRDSLRIKHTTLGRRGEEPPDGGGDLEAGNSEDVNGMVAEQQIKSGNPPQATQNTGENPRENTISRTITPTPPASSSSAVSTIATSNIHPQAIQELDTVTILVLSKISEPTKSIVNLAAYGGSNRGQTGTQMKEVLCQENRKQKT
ncbi:hypothetical protein Dimus_005569 [Dionaea muscipula]